MGMIGHKDPGIYANTEFQRAFIEPVCISSQVIISTKTSLSVVASLYYVHRNAGWTVSRLSRHKQFSYGS